MLVSYVGFSAFRGTFEVGTSVVIAACSSLISIFLDPILIHVFKFGVNGAAIATLCAEWVSAITYLILMKKRNLIRWSKVWKLPSFDTLAPLVKGGLALQVRSFSLNLAFLMVAKKIQALDNTGVSAAAHALTMQINMLGGIALGALSMVAQTLIPGVLVERHDDSQARTVGGNIEAKRTVKRLYVWGFSLGLAIGLFQLVTMPTIMKSSPLQEVRDAAKFPALLGSSFQAVGGIVNVGEGVMMGSGSFFQLSLNVVVATIAFILSLNIFPQRFGLTGVWIGMAVFSLVRLAGVLIYQHINGPLVYRRSRTKLAIPQDGPR